MKQQLILVILAVVGVSVWLLSRFEGSEAAGPGTTMTQELAVVEQVGGEATAVDIQSGYAYIATGRHMQVFDVSEPENPVFVSKTEAFSDTIEDLAVSGASAYVAPQGKVLQVMDVTDPYAPVELGSVTIHSPITDLGCNGYENGRIDQVEIQGQHAYVTMKLFCMIGYMSSLHILDISDPANMYEVSHYVVDETNVTFALYHITLLNNRLYLTYLDHLVILNVSDPAYPLEIVDHALGGFLQAGDGFVDIAIEGTYIYLISWQNFYIFNFANLQNPALVGQYARGGKHLAVADNQAYVLDDGFYVFDISDKTWPHVIGVNQMESPLDVMIAGGHAFLTADALYIFDITQVAGSPEVGFYDAYQKAEEIYVINNHAYLAIDDTLHIVDISQLEQPVLLATTDICGEISDITVDGEVAYLGSADSLCVLDVSNPEDPHLLSDYVFTPIHPTNTTTVKSLVKRGNFLYVIVEEDRLVGCHPVCLWFRALRILNVSNPAVPVQQAIYNNPAGMISEIAIQGGYAYLHGHDSLHVVSLANPTVLVEVGNVSIDIVSGRIAAAENYVYVYSGGGEGKIAIFDVQDPTHPIQVGEMDRLEYIVDLTAVGNTLYLIHEFDLQVIDVTSPQAPVIIGEYSLNMLLYKLHIVGDYAFLAGGGIDCCSPAPAPGAMWILNRTQLTPFPPAAVTELVLFTKGENVITQDDYIYVRDANQLQILFTPDGTNPTKVGEYTFDDPTPEGWGNLPDEITEIAIVGDYLYLLVQWRNELHILDISQPAQPVLVSRTLLSVRSAKTMIVDGAYVYVSDLDGFGIWDVSDPATPTQLGFYPAPNINNYGRILGVIGEYAYYAHSGNFLDVVDISNPAAPVRVTFLYLSLVTDMVVVDDIAYVVQRWDDLLALDVTTPVEPQVVGTYDMGTVISWSIEVAGQVAYVVLQEDGIQMLDISDPTQIQPIELIPLPSVQQLAREGNELFVASGDAGLVTLQLIQESITSTVPTFSSPNADVELQIDEALRGSGEPVLYQRWWQDEPVAGLVGTGMRFEVTAVTNTNTLQQTQPYSVTVHYDPDELGVIREETLALYRQEGSQWLRETSSTLNLDEQTITAVPEQMGQFALLGETYQTYFPTITRGANKEGYRLLLHLDGDGSTVTDLSGYGHDGRCQPAICPDVVPGISQNARHFDGANDVIQVANSQALNLQSEITISAWVKPETSSGFQNIVAHGYSIAPRGEVFLRIANGMYEVGSWDGSDHMTGFPIPVDDIGQWVHLVGVYDGDTWQLYRNGAQVSSTNDETGAVSVHGRWAVGANGNGDGRFFQGSIDEVKVYEHGLTAAEVSELYESYLSQ